MPGFRISASRDAFSNQISETVLDTIAQAVSNVTAPLYDKNGTGLKLQNIVTSGGSIGATGSTGATGPTGSVGNASSKSSTLKFSTSTTSNFMTNTWIPIINITNTRGKTTMFTLNLENSNLNATFLKFEVDGEIVGGRDVTTGFSLATDIPVDVFFGPGFGDSTVSVGETLGIFKPNPTKIAAHMTLKMPFETSLKISILSTATFGTQCIASMQYTLVDAHADNRKYRIAPFSYNGANTSAGTLFFEYPILVVPKTVNTSGVTVTALKVSVPQYDSNWYKGKWHVYQANIDGIFSSTPEQFQVVNNTTSAYNTRDNVSEIMATSCFGDLFSIGGTLNTSIITEQHNSQFGIFDSGGGFANESNVSVYKFFGQEAPQAEPNTAFLLSWVLGDQSTGTSEGSSTSFAGIFGFVHYLA